MREEGRVLFHILRECYSRISSFQPQRINCPGRFRFVSVAAEFHAASGGDSNADVSYKKKGSYLGTVHWERMRSKTFATPSKFT
jgi:hypothetical protein